MKMNRFKKLWLCCILSGLLTPIHVLASLKGSYTVDKTVSASATSYVSFSSLINDLTKGTRTDGFAPNGPGVSGPVSISFSKGSGPYNDQIVFSKVAGTSSTNVITINGNGEVLEFAPTTAVGFVMNLQQVSHVTIENLNIKALNTTVGGKNLQISNGCSQITIRNCHFSQPNNTSASNNSAYIALTNSFPGLVYDDNPGDFITIENNSMSCDGKAGVQFGMYLGYDPDSMINRNIRVVGNNFSDFNRAGVYAQYVPMLEVVNNEFHHNFKVYSGMQLVFANSSSQLVGHRFDSNYIHHITYTSSSPMKCFQVDGNQSKGDAGLSIQHNRVDLDSVEGAVQGVYLNMYGTLISGDVLLNHNNILIRNHTNSTGGTMHGFYLYVNNAINLNKMDMVGNRLDLLGSSTCYGIYDYVYGSKVKEPRLLANNIIHARSSSSTNYCLYLYGSADIKTKLYHNTICSDASNISKSTSTYAIFHTSMDLDVKNNILYVFKQTGYIFGLYFGGNANIAVDYNCLLFDNSGSGSLYYSNGGGAPTSPTFKDFYKNLSGGNDINVDPFFKDVSNLDYTPTNQYAWNYGTPLSEVTTDINGKARSTTSPDMGAIETDGTASLLPEMMKLLVKVYPVPAPSGGVVQISSPIGFETVKLCDELGRTIRDYSFPSLQTSGQIDLPVLAPGIYLLAVEGELSAYQKIVIQ